MAENLVLWPISGAAVVFYALNIDNCPNNLICEKNLLKITTNHKAVSIFGMQRSPFIVIQKQLEYHIKTHHKFHSTNILPSTQLLIFLVFVFEWLHIEDKIIPQRNNLNVRIPMFYTVNVCGKPLYLTPIKCQIQGFPQTPMICQGKNWSTGLQDKSCCTGLL